MHWCMEGKEQGKGCSGVGQGLVARSDWMCRMCVLMCVVDVRHHKAKQKAMPCACQAFVGNTNRMT